MQNPATPNILKQTLLVIGDVDERLGRFTTHFSKSFLLLISSDTEEALKLTLNEPIDLVMICVSSDNIDWLLLCSHLKEHPLTLDIPIILYGQEPSKTVLVSGLEAGALDFVSLPLDFDILDVKIRNHMQLSAKLRTLALISCTDGLTGVPNRMQLDTTFHRFWYAAIRGQHEFSVLMIDIDFFKGFNDTYGHVAGDECLKKVATTIRDCLQRESDAMGRYGGEEFLVLLPFTDKTGAELIGRLILSTIEKLGVENTSSTVSGKVTVSVGVASLMHSEINDENFNHPEFLIERADKCLYAAKHQGRNRLVS
ncbi:diguanylate cyclase [Paraglaciecola sp. 20A4]|uniref:GGDEF domain-containing protein n=1 Tax=Paraglaciecola sp. 20A4 TaxID=2687288 RepID=UPI0014078A8E|nr:diguanylate cyclase [Paraglaciecola sp. 20A4]